MARASARHVDVPLPAVVSTFKTDLIALLPQLRALSRSLSNNPALADDMAQTALAKAWGARSSFQPGTNLKAWLFTILRNEINTHWRRSWRQTHLDDAVSEAIPMAPDQQDWSAQLGDVERALRCIPNAQREAVVLVGAGGVTYEEAALICGVAVGTVKSRVARGRMALIALIDGSEPRPNARSAPGAAMNSILSQLSDLTTKASDL